MKRLLSKVLCIMLSIALVFSFGACNGGGDNTPPAPKYPTLTFVGNSVALTVDKGSTLTDASILSGVTVTSSDSKTYTVAIKDKTMLKLDTVGAYKIKLGAKDGDNWVKKSATEDFVVERTVNVVEPTGINTDDFASLTPVPYAEQSFAENKGIFNLQRAAYDSVKKGLILQADGYIYSKITMPAYAVRHPLHSSVGFNNLEYNSSNYLRIESEEDSVLQVLLYEGAVATDLTAEGIAVKNKFLQLRIPDSFAGKDITVVIYNFSAKEDNIKTVVKNFSITKELDPAGREAYYKDMYKYEIALNATEPFIFTANWSGFHGVSRGDLNKEWSASTDGFGADLRFAGEIDKPTEVTNLTNTGVGMWGKVKVPSGTRKIDVTAGYVGSIIAMRVSLFDGTNFVPLSKASSKADPAFVTANENWMLVTATYDNQKTYSFELDSKYVGKDVMLIVETKQNSGNAEARVKSILFSTTAYVDPKFVDGVDMSTISAMTAISTASAIDFTTGYNNFADKRGTSAVTGGIKFTPATTDENAKAVLVGKITVPTDKKYMKITVSGEANKSASIGMKFVDLETYDVGVLLAPQNVTSAEPIILQCPKFSPLFTGTVGIVIELTVSPTAEVATHAALTLNAFEMFDTEIIADGLGKRYSHDILQAMPIVTITDNTFKGNFDVSLSGWSKQYADDDPGGYIIEMNSSQISLKAKNVAGIDWGSSVYIGTKITGAYVKLAFGSYDLHFTDDGFTAKTRVMVYDKATREFTVLDSATNNGWKTNKAQYTAPGNVFYSVPETLQNKNVVLFVQVAYNESPNTYAYVIMLNEVSFTATNV